MERRQLLQPFCSGAGDGTLALHFIPIMRLANAQMRRQLSIDFLGADGCLGYKLGEVRCGTAFVPFLLSSNRKLHSLGTAFPSTVGGVKVHWCAACNA